jgi:hypothetical protein
MDGNLFASRSFEMGISKTGSSVVDQGVGIDPEHDVPVRAAV